MGSGSMWQYPLIHGHPLLLLNCHEMEAQSLKVPTENLMVLRLQSQTQETGLAKLVDILNVW